MQINFTLIVIAILCALSGIVAFALPVPGIIARFQDEQEQVSQDGYSDSLLMVKQLFLSKRLGMVSIEPAWRVDSFAPIWLSKYARSQEKSSFKNEKFGKSALDRIKLDI